MPYHTVHAQLHVCQPSPWVLLPLGSTRMYGTCIALRLMPRCLPTVHLHCLPVRCLLPILQVLHVATTHFNCTLAPKERRGRQPSPRHPLPTWLAVKASSQALSPSTWRCRSALRISSCFRNVSYSWGHGKEAKGEPVSWGGGMQGHVRRYGQGPGRVAWDAGVARASGRRVKLGFADPQRFGEIPRLQTERSWRWNRGYHRSYRARPREPEGQDTSLLADHRKGGTCRQQTHG